MNSLEKIKIFKQTRKIASDSLEKVLQEVLVSNSQISEKEFANRWLEELRKYSEIFPDGWYIPPPHGVCVLFDKGPEQIRTKFKSLRPEEFWPSDNAYLDRKEGLAIFYFGPVDRKNFIIGDFGLTVYFGQDSRVQIQLRRVLTIIQKVFEKIQIMMKLSEIYELMIDALKEEGLNNDWWISISDPTGINIGHTIVPTDIDWNQDELNFFNSNTDWSEKAKIISKRRVFLNSEESTTLKPGMAITLEPRPQSINNLTTPVVWFHTVGIFYEDGRKELVTDFDGVFKLAGMDYLF